MGMGLGRFRCRTWDRLTRRWCYPSLLRWVLGYGYPAYGCGYGYPSYAYGSSYGYGYRRLIMAAYYPRYRYAGYPYRRAYYGYAGYPYRRSQRAVACEVETTLKRPPSGGLCCFE